MDESLPSPFLQAPLNPLEIEFVLKHILEYVGAASTPDLLKCRLVNHTWNQLVVQILKDKKHVPIMNINSTNIHQYLAVLLKTQLELENEALNSDSDNVDFRSLDAKLDVSSTNIQQKADILMTAIALLNIESDHDSSASTDRTSYACRDYKTKTSPPIISIVKIIDNNLIQANESAFWKLVRFSAPNLEKLQLTTTNYLPPPSWDSDDDYHSESPQEELVEAEDFEGVSFPKLASINYELQGNTYSKAHVDTLVNFIKSCSTPPSLIISAGYYNSITSIEFETARHFCISLLTGLDKENIDFTNELMLSNHFMNISPSTKFILFT